MENKTGKYFKYAIGEIVLVVIGILIALQINSWSNKNKNDNFYGERQKYTNIETLGKVKKTASSVDGNNSAKIYRFNDYNIVEFTTKANALDYDSMDALKKATDKPLIIINESMQFSAGVNLTYTMEFADKRDFK